MAKQRNAEERRARFEKYFGQLDQDGSGRLNYEEFKKFLIQYNKKEMPEKQYEFFFRGADIDGGNTVDKEELFQLVEALYNNDQLYINKLFFRAVDTDKSRKIEADEFVQMAELNGREMSLEDAREQIERLTGGSSTLSFAQMHKALTGQDIPDDTDPYDGQIPGGSAEHVQSRDAPAAAATTSGLSEEEKQHIRDLVKKYDASGDGNLQFDEFYKFMKEGITGNADSDKLDMKQLKYIFAGMDIDRSGNVNSEEIIKCLEAWKSNDFKEITKMIFRGADVDKSRKVSLDELKCCTNVCGKEFNPDDFDAQCKAALGKTKKEIEYWEFYKIITGEEIDHKTDPYDEPVEEKKKSSCCLLL